jgi:hypothetical protein
MRNLRNRNYPATGAIQDRLETAWDKVNAVYAQLASIITVANALAEGGFDIYLEATDIDTLAKLNAILTDATLGDSADFATAAQGILADSAVQPADLDSVAKLDAFVGQAMATQTYVLDQVSGLFELMGTYDASTNTPDLTTGAGIEKAQVWVVDVAGTAFFGVNLEPGDELYALQDTPTLAAHWGIVNRSIDSTAFATAAQGALADTAVQPGDNVSDLTNDAGYYNTAGQIESAYEGIANTNKFTDAEQTKLAGIEPLATADQSAAEIRALVQSATDSNVFTDADHTKLDGIETGAQVTKMPIGGAATQVLTKNSATDYDVVWAAPAGGGATVIDDLTDVDTDKSKTPADGDVLTYDGVHWNAETPSGGGGGGGMTALVKGVDYTAAADELVMVTSDTGTWTIAAEDFLINMDGGRWDGVYDGTTWEYSFVIQTVQPSQTVSDYRYLHRLADGGLSPAGGSFVTHNGVDCISFTPSAQCWCIGIAHVPEDWNGSGIEVRFWGHMSGTSTGAMQWGTATIPTADGDLTTASDAYSGFPDQTPGGVANAMHYTSWMSWNMADLPGLAAGDGFRFKFYRNGNTDANTDTFYLHAVEFRFPVDKTLKALTAISNTASLVPNVQSGTAYTIQATDNGKTIVCTNAAAVSVTLPDGLDQNFQCTVVQYGAGAVTVTPGGSDTVNGASAGVSPAAQYAALYLGKVDATGWVALS